MLNIKEPSPELIEASEQQWDKYEAERKETQDTFKEMEM